MSQSGAVTVERKPRGRSPGRPPAALVEAKEAHLLEIAAAEFLRHGYGEANMARVAVSARVSKKTIYARYPNKDALLLAVADRLTRVSRDSLALEMTSETAEPEAVLIAYATALAHHWASDREIGLYRLIAAEAVRFPELVEVYRHSKEGFSALLADYLLMLRSRGLLEFDDVAATVRLFGFCTIGEVREETLFGRRPDEAVLEGLVRQGVRLFLSGCAVRRT